MACLGTGLIKVDPTPLFALMGKFIPETLVAIDPRQAISNKEIEQFMEKKALQFKAASSAEKCKFPLQGLYMFDGMGAAALMDFGKLRNCTSNSADSDLTSDAALQTGVPSAEFGGIGPYLPGTLMGAGFKTLQYKVRWFCSDITKKLEDGEHCMLTESLFGHPFPPMEDVVSVKGKGAMTWIIVSSEGGRKYTRKSWLNFPWAAMSMEYLKTHATFHEYSLLRLIDAEGRIDQEHVQRFMQKLDGQDVFFADT